MFESHLNDLIENTMNDENANIYKTSKKIEHSRGGLKDLIVHPSSGSGSGSPKTNISTPTSNNSSGSSTPKTSISTVSSHQSVAKTANSSSIKSTQIKSQSLREVLEEWRSEFYPNLTYDDFNENLKPVNNNLANKSKKNGDDIDTDEDEEDEVSDNESTSSSSSGSSSSSNSTKGNDYNGNINYHEYLENNNMLGGFRLEENNENEEKEENEEIDQESADSLEESTNQTLQNSSLLEQRVKQWMKDIHFDIDQSSKIFLNQLPPQIFESPQLGSIGSDLPMTPSTKESPNPNSNSKNQFDLWRENFNKSMDEKMLEKKRTNKITITSNKQ
ncbi:hypothetical protein DICPUDRAFT_91297 [Dictyostelium purpureum]|uniref:Uncharacterized protein n=1 Tax=Dictyostelium purpureum TaxID=5786 RepID=F0ZAD5_DICPU|nr:uncharacterized protein DICPUDRAFT_91297 [Dictyostelium purpureum]EGC39131.1 hypothetical protein DICPUDRAFT_91297 [Dictyostelium purpureum]|eukprot:XP_003284383.1 hypothetical protein DICPUDRAFT_91297 [Dictyostelium purpureum]